MKNKNLIFAAVFFVCFLFYRCTNSANKTTASVDSSNVNQHGGYSSQVEWGKHLATVGSCGDCHTPKKMTSQGPVDDSSLLFEGHPSQIPAPEISKAELAKGIAATNDLTAWVGPWGTSYAANITPDSTGIGYWTEQQFMTCIRQGLFKGIQGSRPIMPPMPIASFRNFSDAELQAIFAFLKTVKPMHNVVPDYLPPAGALAHQ